MERLVDVLPASIETVSLVQVLTRKDMADMLRGLAGRKKEKVPSLRQTMFQKMDPLDEYTKNSLIDARVELETWRADA